MYSNVFFTATGVCVGYLGTVSSPLADFSGLQRTLMTELRPCSHEAVAFLDLQHFTVRPVSLCASTSVGFSISHTCRRS